MLPEFGLINMLGRVYDPTLGVFLSPDNYVQASESVAGYNRYGYCMNNPLKFTDPSGEFFFSAFLGPLGAMIDAACWGAVLQGVTYSAFAGKSWTWQGFGNALAHGAASGAVNALVGNYGGFFDWNGAIPGALGGAIKGGISSILASGVSNLIDGKYFFKDAFNFNTLGISMISQGLMGGYEGYKRAEAAGLNIWWGCKTKYGSQYNFFNTEQPYRVVSAASKPTVKSQRFYYCVPAELQNAQEFYGIPVNMTQEQIFAYGPQLDKAGNPIGMKWPAVEKAADAAGLYFSYQDNTLANIEVGLADGKFVMGAQCTNKELDLKHVFHITDIEYYSYGQIIKCWDPEGYTRSFKSVNELLPKLIIITQKK
jgi:RHS repeat-associated protein